jgi:hypothetical protein
MTSLKLDDVYSSFLDKVTDFDIGSYEEDVQKELLIGYLKGALGIPYLRAIFVTITIDDYEETINYTLKTEDGCDEQFIIELLSKGMVIKWLEPQVKSKVNIAQMFGGKEQKWFSQATHLGEIKDLLENERIELNKLIRDRGSIYNPYLTRKK